MKSEVEVEMQPRTSSASFNTNERTDVTKKLVADVSHLSVVDARRAYDGLTTLGETIDAGVFPDGTRHEVIRLGERQPYRTVMSDGIDEDCPRHGVSVKRCTVRRARIWILEQGVEDWWSRELIDPDDAHTVAYCAHCHAPALTDRPL